MSARWEITNPVRRDYQVEIDGLMWREVSIDRLFRLYMNWLAVQETPPPSDWEEKVWRALHKAYPRHVRPTGRRRLRESVSIPAALAFIGFAVKRLRNRGLVDASEAERRAAICNRCPKRAEVLGCSVCKQALKISVHPPKAVAAPEACSACKCYMPLKVWLPRDLLGPADAFPYAEACWMREEPPA